MENFKEIIQALAKEELEIYSIRGKVTVVNEDSRTCDVEPLDGGAEIFDARLQGATGGSSGIVVIPKLNSEVIVSFLSEDLGFIALTTEVDKILIDTPEITINGGSNKGLIIVDLLAAEIAKLNANFELIKTTWTSAVPVPNDGGAAIKTAFTSALAAIQAADLSKVTNEKIKH